MEPPIKITLAKNILSFFFGPINNEKDWTLMLPQQAY
jgi:hypothetical protein